MKKETKANFGPVVQLKLLRAAVDVVLAEVDGKKVKLESLLAKIEAMRAVRDRGPGKPANTERIALIQQMATAGISLVEIIVATGASESTVRRNLPKRTKGAE
jgi:DNA invertase Pin-like site-specific DNA recombinase